jgi:hypothetical protein
MEEVEMPISSPVRDESALGGGVGVGTWAPLDDGEGMELDSVTAMAGAGAGARLGVGGLGSGQMDPVEVVHGVVPVPGVGADDVAMDLGLAGASAALSGAGGAGRKAIASRLARQRKWAKKREHKASP